MARMVRVAGRFLTPEGELTGTAVFADGLVRAFETGGKAADVTLDDDAWAAPAFVDPHTHGLADFDFYTAEGLVEGARLLGRLGVGAFYPTTASLPPERRRKHFAAIRAAAARVDKERAAAADGAEGGRASAKAPPPARIMGAHYEGPFVNPERVGGIDPASLIAPSAAAARQWLDDSEGVPAIMTWAPELPGALDAGRVLLDAGVALSIGHCLAGADDVRAAVRLGARQITHMHNTWLRPAESENDPPMRGALAAVAGEAELCATLVADLHHVQPERLRATVALLGPSRVIAITDAMTGAGVTPGRYPTPEGGVYTTDGPVARRTDGTVVGSLLTMPRAFANLLAIGMTPTEAAAATSTNAARVMRLPYGLLAPGHPADAVVIDAAGCCRGVFAAGVWYPEAGA